MHGSGSNRFTSSSVTHERTWYRESLNGKLRDECRELKTFYSLKEAQVVISAWGDHYNRVRPHSALGYRPPAPVTREAFTQQLPPSATMQ
jgi:hypothetical protein